VATDQKPGDDHRRDADADRRQQPHRVTTGVEEPAERADDQAGDD
jgi:hypothetical protein